LSRLREDVKSMFYVEWGMWAERDKLVIFILYQAKYTYVALSIFSREGFDKPLFLKITFVWQVFNRMVPSWYKGFP
jgi:hypothetical protein